MKTFVELFDIILTGNKDDSRRAAREARKLLYGSSDGGKYKDNIPLRQRLSRRIFLMFKIYLICDYENQQSGINGFKNHQKIN